MTYIYVLGATTMRLFLLISFYYLTMTAFGQRLNNSINKAQTEAIKTSPYSDAKHFAVSKFQTQFRLTKFPKAISSLLFDKTPLVDTLWIVESFDEMCPDCSSYSSDLLYKDSLYTYNEIGSDSNSRSKFKVSKFVNKLDLYHDVILEVVDSVRQKSNWLANPLHYGANMCNDGDHTIVTIVYPDRRIESLYVRCWTQPDYRTKQ